MALNPPLNSEGDPWRVEGELFVMKRKGVEFEFKVDQGNKYTGKGYMILTTSRIVCINKSSSSFKAFDLPLHLVSKNKFEQPIFGANYIGGDCKPLMNSLPGDIHFKIWFMEGGCGTFIPVYFKMQETKRKNNQIEAKMMSSLQSGTFSKTAYIDPNDPSVIYLEQPAIQGGVYMPGVVANNPNAPVMSQVPPQQMSNQYMSQIPQYQPQQPPYQQQPPMQYQQQPQYSQQQPQGQYPQYPQQQPQEQYPQYPQQQQPMQYQQPPYQQQPPMQYQQQQPPYQPIPSNNIYQPNSNLQNDYPVPNANVLNNVDIPNQNPQEPNAKYFGFWGPELKKND